MGSTRGTMPTPIRRPHWGRDRCTTGQDWLDATDTEDVAQQVRLSPAETVIAWALARWGSRLAVCTSFQAEGMVLLDMAWRIDPKVRVFTVDTGRLPQETYDIMERVRDRYEIEVEVFLPDPQAGRSDGARPWPQSLLQIG